MPPNRAHVLHTISAKAKIIVSPVLLTTHSEALHNGVPNAAATLELLNRFHCDLGYRHLHTMSGASLWQCSPHVALKQPRTQGGGLAAGGGTCRSPTGTSTMCRKCRYHRHYLGVVALAFGRI